MTTAIEIPVGLTTSGIAPDQTFEELWLADTSLTWWLRANTPDTGDITVAPGDLVSAVRNRKNFGQSVAQATTADQPLYLPRGMADMPALHFPGSSERMVSAASVNCEGPCTIVWIGTFDALATSTQFAVQIRSSVDGANNQFGICLNNLGELRLLTGASLTGTSYTLGTPVCVVGAINGTTRKMWVNGTRLSDGVMLAGSGANDVLVLGSITSATATSTHNGKTALVQVYNTDIMEDATRMGRIADYASWFGCDVA